MGYKKKRKKYIKSLGNTGNIEKNGAGEKRQRVITRDSTQ